MNMLIRSKNSYLTSAAFLLLAILFLLVPWEQIQGREFWDRQVFHEQLVSGGSLIDNMDSFNIGYFFVNEVMWDAFSRWLIESIGLPVEIFFLMISFITIYTFIRFIGTRHGILATFFLVNPLIIDLAFSQLRIAFAISLMIIAIDIKTPPIKLLLLVFSMFIHTALALFVGVFFLSSYFIKSKRVRFFFGRSPTLFVLIVALAVSFVVGPVREIILNLIGDRRASYDAEIASLMYSSFWFFYAFIILILMKGRRVSDISVLMGITWVLVYLFVTLYGVYSLRFLSVAFPFIVSTMFVFISGGVDRNDMQRVKCWQYFFISGVIQKQCILSSLLILLFIVYAAIQWYYWIN